MNKAQSINGNGDGVNVARTIEKTATSKQHDRGVNSRGNRPEAQQRISVAQATQLTALGIGDTVLQAIPKGLSEQDASRLFSQDGLPTEEGQEEIGKFAERGLVKWLELSSEESWLNRDAINETCEQLGLP